MKLTWCAINIAILCRIRFRLAVIWRVRESNVYVRWFLKTNRTITKPTLFVERNLSDTGGGGTYQCARCARICLFIAQVSQSLALKASNPLAIIRSPARFRNEPVDSSANSKTFLAF